MNWIKAIIILIAGIAIGVLLEWVKDKMRGRK